MEDKPGSRGGRDRVSRTSPGIAVPALCAPHCIIQVTHIEKIVMQRGARDGWNDRILQIFLQFRREITQAQILPFPIIPVYNVDLIKFTLPGMGTIPVRDPLFALAGDDTRPVCIVVDFYKVQPFVIERRCPRLPPGEVWSFRRNIVRDPSNTE